MCYFSYIATRFVRHLSNHSSYNALVSPTLAPPNLLAQTVTNPRVWRRETIIMHVAIRQYVITYVHGGVTIAVGVYWYSRVFMIR